MTLNSDPIWRTWTTDDDSEMVVKLVYRKRLKLWEVQLEFLNKDPDGMWKLSEFVAKSNAEPNAEMACHAISLREGYPVGLNQNRQHRISDSIGGPSSG